MAQQAMAEAAYEAAQKLGKAWVDGDWQLLHEASKDSALFIGQLEANGEWAKSTVAGATGTAKLGIVTAFLQVHFKQRGASSQVKPPEVSVNRMTNNLGGLECKVRTEYSRVELYEPDKNGQRVAHRVTRVYEDTMMIDPSNGPGGTFAGCHPSQTPAETVVYAGDGAGVRLIRRPKRDMTVVSQLEPLNTGGDVDSAATTFVWGPAMQGCTNDGSPHQGNSKISIWMANSQGKKVSDCKLVPGLKSLAGTFVQWSEVGKIRVQHELTLFETRFVLNSEVNRNQVPELQQNTEGWALVPAAPALAEPQRSLALSTTQWGVGDDKAEMLRMLKETGLTRPTGMPDYTFVQMLSTRIKKEKMIVYHAGKDFAENNGHAPSHAFKTKVGQCGRYSAVMEMACRANGIPARALCNDTNVPHCNGSGFHVVCEVFIEGAGWVFIEPQGGLLGAGSTDYMLTEGTVPAPDRIADSVRLRGGAKPQEIIHWAFATDDKDGNGSLDKAEASALFSRLFGITSADPLGDNGDGAALLDLIKACDTNHDGRISKEELTKAVMVGPLADWSFLGNLLKIGQSTCGAALIAGETGGAPPALPCLTMQFVHVMCNPVERCKALQELGFGGQGEPPNPMSAASIAKMPGAALGLTYASLVVHDIAPDGSRTQIKNLGPAITKHAYVHEAIPDLGSSHAAGGREECLPSSTGKLCQCCFPPCAVIINQGFDSKCANLSSCLFGCLYTATGCWKPLNDGAVRCVRAPLLLPFLAIPESLNCCGRAGISRSPRHKSASAAALASLCCSIRGARRSQRISARACSGPSTRVRAAGRRCTTPRCTRRLSASRARATTWSGDAAASGRLGDGWVMWGSNEVPI